MGIRRDSIFSPRSRRNLVLTASLAMALGVGVLPATALADEGDAQPGGLTGQDVQGTSSSDASSGTASTDGTSSYTASSGTTSSDSPSSGTASSGGFASDAASSGDGTSVSSSSGGEGGCVSGRDSRTDLERAEADLVEKTQARDAAKRDFDEAKVALDGVNGDIEDDVDAIHDEAKARLDEAQGTYEAARDASDKAEANHDEAEDALDEAEDAKDDAEEADEKANERFEDAFLDTVSEHQKIMDTESGINELTEKEQDAKDALEGHELDSDTVEAQKKAYADAIEAEEEARRVVYGGEENNGAFRDYNQALWEAYGAISGGSGQDEKKAEQIQAGANFDASVSAIVEAPMVYDEELGGMRQTGPSPLEGLENARLNHAYAKEYRDVLAGEIAQTEAEIADLREDAKRLGDESDQLKRDAESLEGAIKEAGEASIEKKDAYDEADRAVREARQRYESAQDALDDATPATLARLEAEATAALDAFEAAVAARDEAQTAWYTAERNLDSLKGDRDLKDDRLSEISMGIEEAESRLATLTDSLKEKKGSMVGAEEWVANNEQRVADAQKALDDAKRAYEEAARALSDSVAGDPTKQAAVAKLIDAASTYIEKLEAWYPTKTALQTAETQLFAYVRFNDDYRLDIKYDDDGKIVGVDEHFDNDKSLSENLVIGADAYIAKYEAWRQAADALDEAWRQVDELEESMYAKAAVASEALWDAAYTSGAFDTVSAELEVARGRERVASVREDVLEQALDEAEDELDDARAAYERAMGVTADKVRSGTVTDEEYAWLNGYKDAYDQAKESFDRAKAAYDQARADWWESYGAYLGEWRAAHPVERRVREALDGYYDSLDAGEAPAAREARPGRLIDASARTGGSGRAAAVQAPAAPAGPVATGAVGVAGGEVRLVSGAAMSEVADGVFEVASMPEVDVDALVADDAGHEAADVSELWWCVFVDGVRVRVMDSRGRLAPGIARVVWSEDADGARAALAGVDLGDGTVIVLAPGTELVLEVVWA